MSIQRTKAPTYGVSRHPVHDMPHRSVFFEFVRNVDGTVEYQRLSPGSFDMAAIIAQWEAETGRDLQEGRIYNARAIIGTKMDELDIIEVAIEPRWTDAQLASMRELKALVRGDPDRLLDFLTDAGVVEAVAQTVQPPEPSGMPVVECVSLSGTQPEPDEMPNHMLVVREVPHESRKRFCIYIKRRFGFSLAEAKKAAETPGFVLRKGMARWQLEDVLPDMNVMGVSAEIVVGDGED